MCYMLYLSTSSQEDLSRYNSLWVTFERPDPADNQSTAILENAHKWFVGSMDGCSCRFRHIAGEKLDFAEPQDEFPEDEDEVKAMAELYQVVASLVHAGHKVDCLDLWVGMGPSRPRSRHDPFT
ncbi:MAG TPA: hypothetical protein PKH24_02935 [Sedimentisphaerales bacterium]|jgi:hypothetical protein|nr:hypothetical protein [Sedimentisphaerales bacterium]HNU28012.1 hypothetical protein [Sedimentisphaerales bacterium]